MSAIVRRANQQHNGRQGSTPPQRRRRYAGQGIVELALLTPLLLLILLVAVDFGRAYSAAIEVTSAAREGAAYGSRSSANAANGAEVEAAALADSPSIYGTALTVDPPVVATDTYGYEQITVTVNYDFVTLVSYPGIPDSFEISRTVTMRVIGS